MKGIILAGDDGTKLYPITRGVPKQLLPVYDKPMVYYPLEVLVGSGIKEILIITAKEKKGIFYQALGDGSSFGVRLSYACQEQPEGIAQTIMIGQSFIGEDSVCLMTGDTIIVGDSLQNNLDKAFKAAEKSGNATIFVDNDYDPQQYGVVVLGKNGKADKIIGNSKEPNSYYSIAGLYVFPNSVLNHIFNIEKSERNRYEITSVSKIFHNKQKLQIQKFPSDCKWFDTNSFDGIVNSSVYIQKRSLNKHS